MDFIDWCHHVLRALENERLSPHLSDHRLREIILGNNNEERARLALHQALTALRDAGLAQKGAYNWKITPQGRQVLSDPTDYWTAICEQEITDPEEVAVLDVVNHQSPRQGSNPEYILLEDVTRDEILSAFKIDPPPPKSNDHMRELSKYVFDLPKLLVDRSFLKARAPSGGYQNYITPTYQGMVWETRRGFTIESKFIDEMVREWETTNVEFKREIGLDTEKQKAEFAKDSLGLVTTKSSGRRYMIIGFDDKTRQYYGPPAPAVSQNRMEQVLANLTDPVVTIRYEIIDHRAGRVGKLELFREPEKLPYRASKDVFDDKGKKALEKGTVYVRHGSQTESPTPSELAALEDEGRRARGE